MSRGLTTRQLISRPFGEPDAYWEEDILTSSCKSTPSRPLVLEHFTLLCDRRMTGLTYTETSQPEYQASHLKRSHVFYRGVLTIGSQKWLTDSGKKVLEKELQQRDIQARRRHRDRRDVNSSNMRLPMAFNGDISPKVWIQGIKAFPAVFMIRNQRITEGLYIQTKMEREFDVTSLHPDTAARSQLYFARFRFLHELESLIELGEPSIHTEIHAKSHTHRTVNWFISLYIQHKFSGENPATARANLRSFFGTHCEWMINYQKKIIHKHRQTIHIPSWRVWYQRWKSGTLRDDSWSPDEQLPLEREEEEVDEDMNMREVDQIVASGEDSEESSPPPTRMGVKRVVMNRPRSRKRPRPVSPESSREASPVPPQPPAREDDGESSGLEYVDPRDLEPLAPEPEDHQYYREPSMEREKGPLLDSDFDSDSETLSDAESDGSYVASASKTNPDILEVMPAVISQEPRLPLPGDSWYCPIKDCVHEIDMYHLPDDTPETVISKETRAWVNSCNWSWSDPDIISVFMDLVSAHYGDHLSEMGIERVVADGQRPYFRWIHPEEHPPKHPKFKPDTEEIVRLAEELHMD